MNINKEVTNLLQSKILEANPQYNYAPGDLLTAYDKDISYIKLKFKSIINGYPFGHRPLILPNNTLFMFLSWGAYEYEWVYKGRDELKLSSIRIVTTDKPQFILGMHAFVKNKIMFLTCDYSYSAEDLIEKGKYTYIIKDILPCITRAK